MVKFLKVWLPFILMSIAAVYFLAIDFFPGWFDDTAVAAFGGTGSAISVIIGQSIKKAREKKQMEAPVEITKQ